MCPICMVLILMNEGIRDTDPRQYLVAVSMINLQDEKVAKVYASNQYNLLLTESGKLYGWGSHSNGLLLNGITSGYTTEPTLMVTSLFDKDPIVKISAGVYTVLVLTKSNKIYGWGSNNFGEVRLQFCCSFC